MAPVLRVDPSVATSFRRADEHRPPESPQAQARRQTGVPARPESVRPPPPSRGRVGLVRVDLSRADKRPAGAPGPGPPTTPGGRVPAADPLGSTQRKARTARMKAG